MANYSLTESIESGVGVVMAETLGGSRTFKIRSAIFERRPRSEISVRNKFSDSFVPSFEFHWR